MDGIKQLKRLQTSQHKKSPPAAGFFRPKYLAHPSDRLAALPVGHRWADQSAQAWVLVPCEALWGSVAWQRPPLAVVAQLLCTACRMTAHHLFLKRRI